MSDPQKTRAAEVRRLIALGCLVALIVLGTILEDQLCWLMLVPALILLHACLGGDPSKRHGRPD